MTAVDIAALTKRFGATTAVDGIDLAIASREFVAILGASGCGKTTLLRLLAGLERVDGGSIAFGGRRVSAPDLHVPPETRDVGVVFQSYALWPHMSVADNAGYPLRARRVDAAERAERTQAALDAVELTALAERKPHALSGGQQQRVALARCLTARPGLVLMDEPLANLDMHLRERMLEEFRRFHARAAATVVYITHDQAEAMSIADRIAVMDKGRILQVAAPEELYRRPASAAVARFVGVSSLIETRASAGTVNGRITVQPFGRAFTVPTAADLIDGDAVTLVVRPEDAVIRAGGIPARVTRAAYLGGRFLIEVDVDGQALRLYGERRVAPGETVPVILETGFALGDPHRASDQGRTPAGNRRAIA